MSLFTKLSIALLVPFLITIWIRYEYIKNEMDCINNPYIMSLITLENWETQGMLNCHLSPIQTYNNKGDKYIIYYKHLMDKSGNDYYISFPPFTFIFAGTIFKTLNIKPTRKALQWLNLILHYLSAIAIAYIISLIFYKSQYALFLGFFSGISYLFMPVMLYLHTEIYFPEMLSQVLLIFLTIPLIHILIKNNHNKKQYLTFSLILFLLCYTEWIGYFASLTIGLFVFINFKKNIYYKRLIICTIMPPLAAGLLTFVQYASIAGIKAYLHSFAIRFVERTGFFGNTYSDKGISHFNIHSYGLFFKNLHNALSGYGYFLLLLILIALILKKTKNIPRNIPSNIALYLISTPILIHFLVLFNTNAIHFLCMSKITIIVTFLSSIAMYYLLHLKKYKKLIISTISASLIIAIIISIPIYKNSVTHLYNHTFYKNAGKYITSNTQTNESVFLLNPKTECIMLPSYLTYITKRNLKAIESINELKKFVKKNKIKNYVVFEIDENRKYIGIYDNKKN